MCKIDGCTSPIENPDTGLCAKHNRESRKVIKPKKAYKIPKKSTKGRYIDLELKNVYAIVDSILPNYCGNCGNPKVEHSHILPRGQYPEHKLNVANIFLDCRACHLIWEHGTWEEVSQLRDFKKRLSVINNLAPEYVFRRFKR